MSMISCMGLSSRVEDQERKDVRNKESAVPKSRGAWPCSRLSFGPRDNLHRLTFGPRDNLHLLYVCMYVCVQLAIKAALESFRPSC